MVDTAFNIGFQIGNLSRQVEIVIETTNAKEKSARVKIQAFRVFESLKYVIDELESGNILEKVQIDMSVYLSQLTGISKNDASSDTKPDMILRKLTKKLSTRKLRLDRDLKTQEISELDLKLSMWKDRISSEFVKLSHAQ